MQSETSSASPARFLWLLLGVAAGICIAVVWPHEPAEATQANGNEKFSMCTVNLAPLNTMQGVFVLDHLTGQLRGVAMNPTVGLTHNYYRNIAADFNINPQAANNAKYSMIAVRANLTQRGGIQPASDLVCIAELTSGKCILYMLPYRQANRPIPKPLGLVPLTNFQFRVN